MKMKNRILVERRNRKRVLAAVLLGSALLFISCLDREITLGGVVVDAVTGSPVAGATVSDGAYGKGNFGVTDDSGRFSYITYGEEHTLIVTASGYRTITKTMITPLLINDKEITIEIVLERE